MLGMLAFSVTWFLMFLSTAASGTDAESLQLFAGWNLKGSRDSVLVGPRCRCRFALVRLCDLSLRMRVVADRLGTLPGLFLGEDLFTREL